MPQRGITRSRAFHRLRRLRRLENRGGKTLPPREGATSGYLMDSTPSSILEPTFPGEFGDPVPGSVQRHLHLCLKPRCRACRTRASDSMSSGCRLTAGLRLYCRYAGGPSRLPPATGKIYDWRIVTVRLGLDPARRLWVDVATGGLGFHRPVYE